MRARLLQLAVCMIMGQYSAQNDTVFLLNGHIVPVQIIESSDELIRARSAVSSHTLEYTADQLFKVKFANSSTKFYYRMDSTIGNWLSCSEMEFYMQGERDARAGYKAKAAMYGGFLSGLIGGMTGAFWAPALPLSFVALTGIPKTRIKHHTVSNPELLQQNAYLMGYVRVAGQKKKIRALVSGAMGLILGYCVYFSAHQYYPKSL